MLKHLRLYCRTFMYEFELGKGHLLPTDHFLAPFIFRSALSLQYYQCSVQLRKIANCLFIISLKNVRNTITIPQNEVCAFYVENNCYLFLLLQKKCICIPKSTGISTNLPLLSPPKKLCEKISHGKLSFSNSANSAYIDNIWR